MCAICNKVKKLSRLEALKAIAQAMQQRGAPECLDRLIGELVNEPNPKVDREADSAWESRRSGK